MTGNTSFELCTESLGFESSDCSVGEGEEELDLLPSTVRNDEEKVENAFQQTKDEERGEERVGGKRQKSFPPPLRWMSPHAGKQSLYMKSERKDGRLILTEVRIERPEVFQVSTSNSNFKKYKVIICYVWSWYRPVPSATNIKLIILSMPQNISKIPLISVITSREKGNLHLNYRGNFFFFFVPK